MIAAVAIGMFALPATFSLGGEQHRFKTVESAEGVTAFCEGCHLAGTGDAIQTQLDNSGQNALYASTDSGVIHSTQSCGTCHGVTGGYALSTTNAAGTHAAELPSCLKCHGAPGNTQYGLNNVVPELSDPDEAHNTFNFGSVDDDLHCIGCHTYVAKDGAPSYTFDRAPQQFEGGLWIGQGTIR